MKGFGVCVRGCLGKPKQYRAEASRRTPETSNFELALYNRSNLFAIASNRGSMDLLPNRGFLGHPRNIFKVGLLESRSSLETPQ